MTKSGLADSPFFSLPTNVLIPVRSSVVEKPSTEKAKEKSIATPNTGKSQSTEKPRNQGTTTPRNRDIVVSSNHDTVIEIVRKAVKELGKEAATHRFTLEEKRAVVDIIYAYKSTGVKTSENELARIAINYVLEDYRRNGRNSILDQVLRALNE